MIFCVSKFQKNGRICGFHWTIRSKKCFSFRGLRPPNRPTRGSALGPRWGLCSQIPVIGLRSARSTCPPPLCQILNTLLHRKPRQTDTYWCKSFFPNAYPLVRVHPLHTYKQTDRRTTTRAIDAPTAKLFCSASINRLDTNVFDGLQRMR